MLVEFHGMEISEILLFFDIDEIDEEQPQQPSNNNNQEKLDSAPKLRRVTKNTKISVNNGIVCFKRAMSSYDLEVHTLRERDVT